MKVHVDAHEGKVRASALFDGEGDVAHCAIVLCSRPVIARAIGTAFLPCDLDADHVGGCYANPDRVELDATPPPSVLP